jgi:hypothetical protein
MALAIARIAGAWKLLSFFPIPDDLMGVRRGRRLDSPKIINSLTHILREINDSIGSFVEPFHQYFMSEHSFLRRIVLSR